MHDTCDKLQLAWLQAATASTKIGFDPDTIRWLGIPRSAVLGTRSLRSLQRCVNALLQFVELERVQILKDAGSRVDVTKSGAAVEVGGGPVLTIWGTMWQRRTAARS